ncbi:hypothetical protein SCT_3185 [Sulfuricella sp. T08]|nr:hypothetical protein SCT_3185 [Sulfuricella sp. T08]
MLVGLAKQRFQAGDIGGAEQPDDALATVRQILDQLEQATANGKYRPRRIARPVKHFIRGKRDVVDRVVYALAIADFQPGEQDRLADAAADAVGTDRR